MTDTYERYTSYVKTICDSGDLSNFKTNPNYSYMLEHVSPDQALQYIECIKTQSSISDSEIQTFSNLNDAYGSPTIIKYGEIYCSPTTTRYIYHTHIILTYLQSLNMPSIDIIEIGCGYGGLYLAICHFANKYSIKINSYTLIDLKEPSRLQKLYLSNMKTGISTEFVDATTFGKDINKNNMFLISNYAFSEISYEFQQEYIRHLFPKIAHGFMAWNFIKTYNFGFLFKEEEEIPNTGGIYNKYVYF